MVGMLEWRRKKKM